MRFDHGKACRGLAEIRIKHFDHQKACRLLAAIRIVGFLYQLVLGTCTSTIQPSGHL